MNEKPTPPFRLFPDILEAGLYGALLSTFAVNLSAPLYEHARRLITEFSLAALTGLLALPPQIFLAALSSLFMVLVGLITALPSFLGGVMAANELQARGVRPGLIWLAVGGVIGLANALLLVMTTAIGNDGAADLMRAFALYGGGGVCAAFYVLRQRNDRVFYNN